MRLYEYGEYDCTEKDIIIPVGGTRRTWISFGALPVGMSFDEYFLEEDDLYTYKVISDNCVQIKNTGEEPLVITFIRHFKK